MVSGATRRTLTQVSNPKNVVSSKHLSLSLRPPSILDYLTIDRPSERDWAPEEERLAETFKKRQTEGAFSGIARLEGPSQRFATRYLSELEKELEAKKKAKREQASKKRRRSSSEDTDGQQPTTKKQKTRHSQPSDGPSELVWVAS